MAAVSMSKQEFVRLEVLLGVQSGRLRVADVCALIGLRRRQVFRLLRGFKQNGAASLLSKRRGRPSNRRLPGRLDAGISVERISRGSDRRTISRRRGPQYDKCPSRLRRSRQGTFGVVRFGGSVTPRADCGGARVVNCSDHAICIMPIAMRA